METYIYSPRITIHGAQGSQLASAAEMPRAEAKRFISAVRGAFRKLDRLRTGRRLIAEINGTTKQLRIFCASNGEGAVLSDPPTVENNFRRLVRSFRPAYKNMIPVQSRATVEGKRDQFLKGLKGKLQAANLHSGTVASAPELDAILIRAWGTQDAGRGALARGLGRPRAEIDDLCDGITRIEDDTYFKICFAYYAFLTPGPGCDAQMKLKASVRLEGVQGAYRPKRDVGVAPEIILGHELIHAWRIMTGRRIVDNGWEEEAMTVGISPFSHLEITENRLRQEGGYPRRASYAHSTYSTTMGTDLAF